MGLRCPLLVVLGLIAVGARGEGLDAASLAVVYNLDDPASRQVAFFYAIQRAIPSGNLIGIHLPSLNVMTPRSFLDARADLLERLPSAAQALLLVWSRPYAVGCMSITSAMAIGYAANSCPPECARTPFSPLFDSEGWLPTDTLGWWPAMLMPSDDVALAERVIRRGVSADFSAPPGILFLIRTDDVNRNVRARGYHDAELDLGNRLRTVQLATPITGDVPDAIGYFTGVPRVSELARIHFRPGALADHLTSKGGILGGSNQMSALAWLQQGATATYGSVSEPCSYPGKFPNIRVLFEHYLHGETALEAYWKSVEMPSQGLFLGEPLARPFAAHGS